MYILSYLPQATYNYLGMYNLSNLPNNTEQMLNDIKRLSDLRSVCIRLANKQARMFILACLLVGLRSWQLACYLFACLIYMYNIVHIEI